MLSNNYSFYNINHNAIIRSLVVPSLPLRFFFFFSSYICIGVSSL